MLYLKVLACKALFREINFFAVQSQNVIDLTCFEWGLHDKVGALNEVLKNEIASIDSGKDPRTSYPPYGRPFDAILLFYGLCSNGTVGLSSERYPLVIPRAHDCITLLLGSKERYRELFDAAGGTYWYSPGWVENSPMPGQRRRQWMIDFYTEKYGLEGATVMTDTYSQWQENYSRLGLIQWPEFRGTSFANAVENEARTSAEYAGLEYESFEGDSTLVKDFIEGNWDEERFLVVPPNEAIKPSYRDDIVKY